MSRPIEHGHASRLYGVSTTYKSWSQMRYRCTNPNNNRRDSYMGKGIKICERWNDFENFLEDMGECPENMSIDRINNDGDYEPSNCKWSNAEEQARNRSSTRLSIEIAAHIILERRKGTTYTKIAEMFGTDQSTASKIDKGRIWNGAIELANQFEGI